jgi:GMP synthase-like glutamine amidotransferase
MKIHCLQHLAFENPGTIAEWAAANNHSISYTYFFKPGFTLPLPGDFDMLLIMGGYMNVDEERKFPWLKKEKDFIKKSIDAGKKVTGICLGAQLIAAALGNKVYKGKEKEIGFFPIHFTNEALSHPLFSHFENPYTVFHWHGDTFDLPEGAMLVASTDVCKHQAFLIKNNVLGLQFHFEMNEDCIEGMLLHDGRELNDKGNFIATAEEIFDNYSCLQQNKEGLFKLLDKFTAY